MSEPQEGALKGILVKPGTKKPRKPNPVEFSQFMILIEGKNGTEVPLPDDKHGKREKKVLKKEGIDPEGGKKGSGKKSSETVGNVDIEQIIGKSIYDSDSEESGKSPKNNRAKDEHTQSITEVLWASDEDKKKKKKFGKKKGKKNLKIGNEAATLILENIYEILLLKSKFSQNCKFIVFSNGIIDCYEHNEGESEGYAKYVMSFICKCHSDNSVAVEFSNKTPNLITHWTCLQCIPSIKSDGETEPSYDDEFSMLIIFKDSTERTKFNTSVEKFFFKSKKSKIMNFRHSSAKNLKNLFSGKDKKTDPFPGVNFHDDDDEVDDDGKKIKKNKKKSKKSQKNNEKNESDEEDEISETPPVKPSSSTD